MKLSNKILIGFFGFIFIYLTAAFTELRLKGTPNFFDEKNSITETLDLPGISYLVLENADMNINVSVSDRPRIELKSYSGGLLPKLKYKITGDSLALSGFQQSESLSRIRVLVFLSKTNLKEISVHETNATIEGLQLEHLKLSGHAARIWMTENKISSIHTDLSGKSFLDISRTSIDTLSLNVDESQLHISSPVGLLRGIMKNSAHMELSKISEIQMKKDETSRLNMY